MQMYLDSTKIHGIFRTTKFFMAKRERICLAVSLLLCHVTICHNEGVTLRQRQTKAGTLEFTHREYARLQTFPDDFIFSGSKTSICKQIGNAVPPRLAEFLAHFILYLNSKYNGNENK